MWQVYVFGLLAGFLGANGVPHFVSAEMGKKFMTPFGKDSSPLMNLAWGWLNFVVAGILFYYSHYHAHLLRAFASVAVGALIAGFVLVQAHQMSAKK
ncbi:MAG TPA: hypothetical protein VFN31_02290 [Candidatus Saccharimonadales bacterium]|nr:hypothetical protein [Candidatus Saccharimonadales bacterium]